jgi:allantoicase
VTDLISKGVGGRIVEFNDEFFAEAENLLKPDPPIWIADAFTDRGKWMDGWETRRRRDVGHDWCVIALGVPGAVRSVTVDTAHFTGNYPEAFSLDACGVGSDDRLDESHWVEVIPRTELLGSTSATFEVDDPHRSTHVRLNIYPDGGIARLRIEGDPIPSRDEVCPDREGVDLASALVGGAALEASDSHYSPPSSLLRHTEPAGMWDGWETKRRRGEGNDWATFRLGLPGTVEAVDVDTRFFKGNSPGWVAIHLSDDGETWQEVVTRAEVKPDTVNAVPLTEPTNAQFLRLDIHPDGGVARMRVWGRPDREAAMVRRIEYLNALFESEARALFHTACAARAWVETMTGRRPFLDGVSVLSAATEAFDLLEEHAWLEAFAGHPRIGEMGDDTANTEQAGVAAASGSVRGALSDVNRSYEEKNGFTYIVYATGRTAVEMLEIAQVRLTNDRDQEIANAAGEQRAITETRLRRILCMGETR